MADMTLGSAQGAVDSLLGSLTSILVHEAQLLGGVRRDVQFIKDEMESMNGFLLHMAEAVEEDHHQVGAWMKQVAEVAYASQNSVDRYIQSIGGGRREPGLLGYLRRLPKLVWTLPTRHRIANQIRELKIRSCEVGKRRMRYDVKVPEPDRDRAKVMKGTGWQTARNDDTKEEDAQRRSCADYDVTQGRMDGHFETVLINFFPIVGEHYDLAVIAAVGMGGIGKSYEVARAYQDASVMSSFDCKAWICLGQESTEATAFLGKILAALESTSDQPKEKEELFAQHQLNEEEEIITQLQPKDEEELIANLPLKEMKKLTSQLQQRLKGKRFLLVIDDVRDRSLWSQIRSAFPKENCSRGSVILITTRSTDVAQSFCPHEYIDLDTGTIWYVRNAEFLMNINHETDLRPILWKILSKPLPVRLFLRALYVNPNKTQAELQSLCDNLDNSTLSSNNARQVLKFCNLTSSCMNCLLYMYVAPKDTTIERTRLVGRWAAEGLTPKRGRLSALDEADHCFDLLVAHGFLRKKKEMWCRSVTGKVKTCTMDDITLQIVTQIVREDHLVKYVNHADVITYLNWEEFCKSYISPSHSRIMKVFDRQHWDIVKDHHLKNIWNHAFHLKYLNLRGTGITELPKQLDKLQSLEILDIRQTKVKAFAKNSVFLPNLKHLLAGLWTAEEVDANGNTHSKEKFSTVAIPKHVGDMTKLQVISHIAVSGDGSELKYVGHLLQLVKLGLIVSGSKTSSILRHLYYATGNLGLLRSLSIQVAETEEENENLNKKDASAIYPKYLHKLKISGLNNGLPSWVEKLKILSKMTLHMTLITDDDFNILGQLTSLSGLRLQQESCNESTLTFKKDVFQCLKFLDINCSAITSINFDNEACPKLKKLSWYSTREQSLTGIERLPNLKKLELTGIFDRESVKQAIAENRNNPSWSNYSMRYRY